ncbi:YIP1 family protein [Alishewanella sp. 16-MA]|uniref:YIP1 family protein n=1 Tax=Alishewanella maricola TaxID=2795740 RepID=A0ABS8C041_9ALTE|nr:MULTISPECIES: Yip1 family protein [Gammaproteobacteria]MDP4945389.1 YIP1 family protein [Alishewanella sp.]MCB5225696.1 YIP1 family protein [Alishewanella maricola]MCC5451632.1 YIP1 family protein [Rheinheimera sp. UJ51]MCF4008029.1 YIP1 family protein [Rheinheimera sp. UJ63]MDP5037331.1 YIP1 family protein [Alishewanella sp.]
MILNHLWGIYAHPKEEWHTIDARHESLRYSLIHILLVALIPSICAYYSAVHLGWSIGVGEKIFLTANSALMLSVAMYFALIIGVLALALLAHWMAHTFGAEPTYTQTLELSSYTSTPLFMVGLAALYPELWFVMVVGLAGLTYSVYLLYVGVPILMHIPEERGFIYASSVVTSGLILLVTLLAATAILWSSGFGPAFTH